jgi:hypothetical protein
MVIIGQKNRAVRPAGYLEGPSGIKIPITSFAASFTVGNIPVARVGILPESLRTLPDDANEDIYSVRIGDDTQEPQQIFRGYVCGPSGRLSPTDIRAGVDLIHVARDLDQMRLSAPSLHPQGCNDWSYRRAGSARVATQGNGAFPMGDNRFFQASRNKSLPAQIIEELIHFMENELRVEVQRSNPAYLFKKEDFQPAVDLLKTIKFFGGGTIRSELAAALANPVTNSINGHLVNSLNESFLCQRSIWDALTAALSDFGLLLLCDNAGQVFVIPDLSNFQPPEENLLDGEYIITRDQSSTFFRQIREVMLVSRGIVPSPNADGGGGAFVGTITSWPPPKSTSEQASGPAEAGRGATLSLMLPGWLSPISYLVDREELRREPPNPSNPKILSDAPKDTTSQRRAVAEAQSAYAHMLYNLERDKRRTFCLTGPLAPRATPGTTVRLRPFSAVRARTTGADLRDFDIEYHAYLYQVSHFIECGGAPTMTTTFNFRNVSKSDEGLSLTEHPLFSDCAPFKLQ